MTRQSGAAIPERCPRLIAPGVRSAVVSGVSPTGLRLVDQFGRVLPALPLRHGRALRGARRRELPRPSQSDGTRVPASRRKSIKRRPVLIQHAVWVYLRFTLSYRDVEDLLAERGRPMIWAHRMTFIESAGRVVLGFQIWSRNVGPS